MSGLEIVAAVSAVVSAFHGGSELLKLVKQKRRARKARDHGQQEWEEEQLQASLLAGEQQIDLRYKQDQRELGDYVRGGDDTARDRLYRITLMLQAEIINSLQQAATNEVCVLNLHVLHEASITNRKETLTTLDELKQRIYTSRPMVRQLRVAGKDYKDPPSASVQTMHTNRAMRSLSDNYPAANFSSQMDLGYTRHSLSDYCRQQETRDTSRTSQSAHTLTQAADPDFNSALGRLRPGDRASILKDIQHMISSYQGLSVENGSGPSKSHTHNGAHPVRRDTLTMLNDRDIYAESVQGMDQGVHHRPYEITSASGQVNTVKPTVAIEQEQHFYNQPHLAPSPYHQTGTHMLHPRWSDASSSAQSNEASLGRNSPSSSQGDHARPPMSSYDHYDESRSAPPYSSPYTSPEDRYTPSPIAPLAPLRPQPYAPPITIPKNEANTPTHMPWPGSQQQRDPSPPLQQTPSVPYVQSQNYTTPIGGNPGNARQTIHPQWFMPPPTESGMPSQRGNSDHQMVAYSSPTIVPTSSMLGSPATSRTRHASITPSVASTDSSSSFPIGILPGHRMRTNIRSDTIQGGPAGGERMMNGRPNKDNDYWGFCRSAWAVREDPKKGITLRTQPSGYYGTKQIWGCKSCTFTGDVFTKPHPTKKNKTVEIVDPRVKTSISGIRYRWIFLAKSHVRKRAAESSSKDDNFGCVLCLAQDKVTGVYGGVETLMNHIALTHVVDMSEQAQKKANCILGRVASYDEEFDINIPIFKEAELAG